MYYPFYVLLVQCKAVIYIYIYILVKALSQVLYNKKQHEGWGFMANTALGKQQEYTVLLLICWVCVGGLHGGLHGGLLVHSADLVSKHDRIVAQCTMKLVYKIFKISSAIVSVS